MTDTPELGNISKLELVSFMLGNKLGHGASREVYALGIDGSKVIKYEYVCGKFDNAHEWGIWSELCDTQWARWLAPCRNISPCGTFLIQDRTAPLREFPKGFKIPSFMADAKPENFGMLGGRIVAHDYGNHRLFHRGAKNIRMVSP